MDVNDLNPVNKENLLNLKGENEGGDIVVDMDSSLNINIHDLNIDLNDDQNDDTFLQFHSHNNNENNHTKNILHNSTTNNDVNINDVSNNNRTTNSSDDLIDDIFEFASNSDANRLLKNDSDTLIQDMPISISSIKRKEDTKDSDTSNLADEWVESFLSQHTNNDELSDTNLLINKANTEKLIQNSTDPHNDNNNGLKSIDESPIDYITEALIDDVTTNNSPSIDIDSPMSNSNNTKKINSIKSNNERKKSLISLSSTTPSSSASNTRYSGNHKTTLSNSDPATSLLPSSSATNNTSSSLKNNNNNNNNNNSNNNSGNMLNSPKLDKGGKNLFTKDKYGSVTEDLDKNNVYTLLRDALKIYTDILTRSNEDIEPRTDYLLNYLYKNGNIQLRPKLIHQYLAPARDEARHRELKREVEDITIIKEIRSLLKTSERKRKSWNKRRNTSFNRLNEELNKIRSRDDLGEIKEEDGSDFDDSDLDDTLNDQIYGAKMDLDNDSDSDTSPETNSNNNNNNSNTNLIVGNLNNIKIGYKSNEFQAKEKNLTQFSEILNKIATFSKFNELLSKDSSLKLILRSLLKSNSNNDDRSLSHINYSVVPINIFNSNLNIDMERGRFFSFAEIYLNSEFLFSDSKNKSLANKRKEDSETEIKKSSTTDNKTATATTTTTDSHKKASSVSSNSSLDSLD
ncbi:unnamed protein product [[Candida] boidinii]|nr:unnamed protein product [[Candida] boidinii]